MFVQTSLIAVFPILCSTLSLIGSMIIIAIYLKRKELRDFENSLVALLSMCDFFMHIFMLTSTIYAIFSKTAPVVYILFPVTNLVDFFVCASWLWVAVISYASLNMEKLTSNQELRRRAKWIFHIVVWGGAFVSTAVDSIIINVLKETDTYLVFVGIVGIVIYIWNVSVLIVVIVKVKSAQSEIQFATEKGKTQVQMFKMGLYLVPFIICWSFFLFGGMNVLVQIHRHEAVGNKSWVTLLISALPNFQGVCNAATFGLTNFRKHKIKVKESNAEKKELLSHIFYDDPEEDEDRDDSDDFDETSVTQKLIDSTRPLNYALDFPTYTEATPVNVSQKAFTKSVNENDDQSIRAILANAFLLSFSFSSKLAVSFAYCRELHGTTRDYGVMMAAYGLGWFIMMIPYSCAKRLNSLKKCLVACALFSILDNILWIFASNSNWLIVSRFIAGIAAACGIVGNAYITSTSQNFNSAKILNFTSTSIIGFICGIVVVAVCDFIPPAGHFNVHWHLFEKFPYIGWFFTLVYFIFLIHTIRLHPKTHLFQNSLNSTWRRPLPIYVVIIVASFCELYLFLSAYLPIMHVVFKFNIVEVTALLASYGVISLLIQRLLIGIILKSLRSSERLGVFIGILVGVIGCMLVAGFTERCTMLSIIIGGMCIFASTTITTVYSFNVLVDYFGTDYVYKTVHVYMLGSIGQIAGSIWGSFSVVKNPIDDKLQTITTNDISSLVPFTSCMGFYILVVIFVGINFKRL